MSGLTDDDRGRHGDINRRSPDKSLTTNYFVSPSGHAIQTESVSANSQLK
jgi:hypothetical protein